MAKAVIQLHFDIDEEWLRELEELRVLGGLRTKKDLLNNALTILNWAAQQRLNGRAIVSVGSDGNERELATPYLDAVAASAKNRGSQGVLASPQLASASV